MILTAEQNVSEPKKIETISISMSDWDACKQRCNKLEQYYNRISIIEGLLIGLTISALIGFAVLPETLILSQKVAYRIVCLAVFIILLAITILSWISKRHLELMKVSYCSRRSAENNKEK